MKVNTLTSSWWALNTYGLYLTAKTALCVCARLCCMHLCVEKARCVWVILADKIQGFGSTSISKFYSFWLGVDL